MLKGQLFWVRIKRYQLFVPPHRIKTDYLQPAMDQLLSYLLALVCNAKGRALHRPLGLFKARTIAGRTIAGAFKRPRSAVAIRATGILPVADRNPAAASKRT